MGLQIGGELNARIALDRLRPAVPRNGSVTEPPRTVTGWPLGAAIRNQSWLLSVTRTAMRSPALSFQSAPQSVSGIVESPVFLTSGPGA